MSLIIYSSRNCTRSYSIPPNLEVLAHFDQEGTPQVVHQFLVHRLLENQVKNLGVLVLVVYRIRILPIPVVDVEVQRFLGVPL
jgi:hypothetical protein